MSSAVTPTPTSTLTRGPTPSRSNAESLRETARQLEAVFVNQLFQAMRATVHDDGLIKRGPGEEMFTSMLDQRVAEHAPTEWSGSHSLADALYRQLSRRLAEGESR